MSKEFIADCGHLIPALPENHCGGSGYGTDAHGATFCYDCAAVRERDAMVSSGAAVLYLTRNGHGPWNVTDWPGKLSFPVREMRTARYGGGFGAQRTDAWFIGPDGFLWHAINRGDMDVARCRRTKQKAVA